jgi:hypothetical protein
MLKPCLRPHKFEEAPTIEVWTGARLVGVLAEQKSQSET